ncbi:MAG: PAS domain S-box protein [Deltaproteobacteria bacterium]|nr:PAS domain S-box protein [Deltaproteobacteria bacterium]
MQVTRAEHCVEKHQSAELSPWLVLLLVLALTLAVGPPATAASLETRPRILILNSYHPGNSWSDEEQNGLLQVLRQAYPPDHTWIEYLDTKRFAGPEHLERLRTFLAAKYQDQKIDLVVALDNNALSLVCRAERQLFPGVPVVFLGINDFHQAMLAGRPKITGVVQTLDVAGTLALAMQLQPGVKEVLAIHDQTLTGLAVQAELKAALQMLPDAGLKVTFTPPESFSKTLERVQALAPDHLGLLLPYHRDSTGRVFDSAEIARLVTATSRAPVYGFQDYLLGQGIVGGLLLSGRQHGQEAGQVVLRVLRGEDPAAIPLTSSRVVPMFDAAEMAHFPLVQSALPPDTILINKPQSFWEQYHQGILTALGVFLVMALVITFMAATMIRRRRAEKALRLSEERLRLLFDSANEGILVNQQGVAKFFNQSILQMLGCSAEEFSRTPLFDFIHPDDREMIQTNYRRRLAGEKFPNNYPFRIVDRQGSVKWVHSNNVALDWEGQPATLNLLTDITEQRQAEAGLKASEENHKQILETAMDGFWRTDLEGRIKEINQAYCRMSGYAEAELLHMRTSELEHPADEEGAARRRAKLLAAGEDRYETRHRRKDGSLFDIEMSVQFKTSGDGGECIAFLRDISERKATEEALVTERRRLSNIIRGTNVGTWEWNIVTGEAVFNEKWAEILGYTLAELSPVSVDTWLRLAHPDDLALSKALLRQHFAGELAHYEIEVRMRHKQGHWVWILDRGQVVAWTPEGKALLMSGTHQDITARKQAEECLRLSEDKFKKAFQASPDAICLTRAEDGLYLEVNQGFTQMTGYAWEDVAGKTSLEINIFQNPAVRKQIGEGIRSQGVLSNFETQFKRKDGSFLPGLMSAIYLDVDGTRCVLSITRDITELKQAEEQHKELERQLLQAQKMEAIGTLAGGIAHDFNNILGAVMGFAEIAYADALGGRTSPADLQQILAAALRAKELVQQILAFSRKKDLDLRPLDLSNVVARTVAILQRTLPKMVEIVTELSDALPLIQGDATQIEQILFNLASNAQDALPEGGRLVFRTGQITLGPDDPRRRREVAPGTYVLLEVEDNGLGMDEKTLAHVFEPFFTTKEVGKGTGLGLSSAYGIVKSHGGYLGCASQPGRGTTFTIYLPAMAENGLGHHAPAGCSPTDLLGGSETILLVDDEAPLREIGARVLASLGYRVLTAASGEEAVARYQLEGSDIDLVIMDMGMPGIGGHKALKAILEANPRAKVMIVSGYAAGDQIKEALEAGGSGYVAKPFKLSDLLATVRSVLDRK